MWGSIPWKNTSRRSRPTSGGVRDAASIHAGSLRLGKHGIDVLVNDWVYPVLDCLDDEHPTYDGMRALVLSFSQQLALRLRDFTKVILATVNLLAAHWYFHQAEGKSKAPPPSPFPGDGDGDDKPEAKSGVRDVLPDAEEQQEKAKKPPRSRATKKDVPPDAEEQQEDAKKPPRSRATKKPRSEGAPRVMFCATGDQFF